MNGRAFAALAGQESVIVIRRPFVAWLGHVSDALLMDQLIYWQDAAGAGHWFPMADAQLAAHLCLTEYEISQARARLAASGMLEAARMGIPARMHYRLDVGAAFRAFAAFLDAAAPEQVPGISATSSPESPHWRGETAEHTTYKVDKGINGENKNQNPNGADNTPPATDAGDAGPRRRGRPRKVRPEAADGGAAPAAPAALRGNWPEFRARVLADYGAIASKGNHALISNIARTAAEAHGLAEPQALAAWAEFWAELIRANQTKYVTLAGAANRFGQWLKSTIAERRRTNA